MHNQYFATCPRGLELLLSKEIQEQGGKDIHISDGGVGFSGDLAVCYRANLYSRLATRILMQVGRGRYASEDDLYQGAMKINWPNWFDIKHDFLVKVTAVRCPLKSLEFVTLRIKDAICDRFRKIAGERPNVNTRDPKIRVHAYITQDQYQLYVDTSGQPLYQRGYRKHSIEAPLRENLAAGIIRLSGWQPGNPLLDPMCGSGTFLLEAVMMALSIAPGLQRSFAFEHLRNYASDEWKKIRNDALKRVKPVSFLAIYGADSDPRALKVTRQNLEAAGWLEAVKLIQQPFENIDPPAQHGVLIANPPYGVRIGEDEALATLYPLIAANLKQKFAGWNAYFLTNDLRMPKLMRLSPSKKTPLFNGPLECRLFEIKIVAGSNRKF